VERRRKARGLDLAAGEDAEIAGIEKLDDGGDLTRGLGHGHRQRRGRKKKLAAVNLRAWVICTHCGVTGRT